MELSSSAWLYSRRPESRDLGNDDVDGSMLARLTRTVRWRAAVIVAVLYGLCAVAPAAALALSGTAAHCLTDQGPAHVHHAHGKQAATSHTHADGTVHLHHDSTPHKHADEGGQPGGSCCGLFCITALPAPADVTLAAPVATTVIAPARADALTAQAPGRINRPPIT